MKKIGVLTSSRSDYGILLPLLKKLKQDPEIDFKLIVFGTHLSHLHGYTIDQILNDGFEVRFRIHNMVIGDSQESVSASMGFTQIKFSSFWDEHRNEFDIVLCPGDRFEMFAAVSSGIPFNICFAHIHAGEKTLGAIDNIFRHSISHASTYHFTATEIYAERVRKMIDLPVNVYNVGALSLDNISDIAHYSIKEFKEKWNIDLDNPTVLITFHPETITASNNMDFAMILAEVIKELRKKYQIIITMPNADTEGNVIRSVFHKELSGIDKIFLIENFGTRAYFSAMKYCSFLLGNTSSGIIEAASFNKYVINIGDRQKGRVAGENVLNVCIDFEQIIKASNKIETLGTYSGENIYWDGGAATKILQIIKHT